MGTNSKQTQNNLTGQTNKAVKLQKYSVQIHEKMKLMEDFWLHIGDCNFWADCSCSEGRSWSWEEKYQEDVSSALGKDQKEIIRERPSKGHGDPLYDWNQNMFKDELQRQSKVTQFHGINDAQVKILGKQMC